MKIGYARVSTDDQTLALQLDALRAAGCEVIHEDRLSGAAANRPGLNAALAACQPGDVLHVWKLDRLGRSMAELVGIARFVQFAMWRLCSTSELDICNGTRIDDRHRCENNTCPAFSDCDRVTLHD